MRDAVLGIATSHGMQPSHIRDLLCALLFVSPDRSNWSEYPNIWGEVEMLAHRAEWWLIYDLLEEMAAWFTRRAPHERDAFHADVNEYFKEAGIGWQLTDGVVEVRGPEAFEAAVRGAVAALDAAGRTTARSEIHEALADLGRRPDPDLTGAVQHAMGALECVVRDATGDGKATLGALIQRNPGLLPKPLDGAVEKAWGYASERGRHVREGHAPDFEEAELLVGLAATIATYLTRKVASTT